MLDAVTDALGCVLDLIKYFIHSVFYGKVSSIPEITNATNLEWLGTAIVMMIAVSAVFFALRAILKTVWGR